MSGIFERVYDEESMAQKGKSHRKKTVHYTEADNKAKEAEKIKYMQKVK